MNYSFDWPLHYAMNASMAEDCFFLPNPFFEKVYHRYATNLITSILNGVFSPVAVVGNFAIIFTIWKMTWLRDPSSLLLGCLAISDMLVGFIVQPSYVSYRLSENRDHFVPCFVRLTYSTSFYVCYGVSFMTLNAISCERYIALALHLRYQSIVTKRRILLLAGLIWIVNTLLTSLQWAGINTEVRAIHLTTWFVCLLTSFLLQFKIFSIVRHHYRQIQRQVCHLNSTNAHIYRHQLKLAVNVAYIVAIYFFFNLPVLLITTYHQIVGGRLTSYNYYSWAETVALLNSSLNPLVCCWKNRNVRKAVLRFLIAWTKCERLPRDQDHLNVTGVRNNSHCEYELPCHPPQQPGPNLFISDIHIPPC